MPRVRFDHLELTVPVGELTQGHRDEIDEFFCGVFGWISLEHMVFGQSCHMLRPDDGQFVLIAESKAPMSPAPLEVRDEPGEAIVAHLGLAYERIDEVDELFAACETFRQRDQRVRLKDFGLRRYDGGLSRNFLVSYLLPVWLDVHAAVRDDEAPARQLETVS